ncbi:cell envelope integrity protein CreD [Luteirhabdus pelagi]|jgi:inner membrane protein|uniref:cell envelope integrity protein CreD n=1 Tax=Luteirhabdus pelagi TaxID=2792783 RepID=UPI0019394479|nr:cell envelope integrity protein CreD [Luteirhabdus pelagi]
MLVVGFLLLVLLIPLSYVQDLIRERSFRQKDVVAEINDKWGTSVLLSGPILKIPYTVTLEEKVYIEKNKSFEIKTTEQTEYAYLLPDELDVDANVTTHPLNRSIYESVVYDAAMQVQGSFPLIDLSERDIKQEAIQWDKITLLIQSSNLKGITETISVSVNGSSISLSPKYGGGYLNTIQSDPLDEDFFEGSSPISFSFPFHINGSESLQFIPIGKETMVSMESNWHSPSFNGKYLPENGSREISEDGFKARWKVLQINRQFEQLFFNKLPSLTEFAFGTNFVVPVDEYQKSERAAKYGFMVIGITLLVFLLIQLVSKINIHPFQYLMIGLALVLFYTLLIAITEHSSFLKAYAISAVAVLLLIMTYSRAILKGFKFPILIGASLASLYGFIYVIIQLENYALLVGSIGLFVILATIMFVSRNIDWQGYGK